MSTDRKIFIVWNPASGGHGKKIVNELTRFIGDNYSYQVFDTQASKGAKTLVESRFDENFTDLLIIGGDGTINEAVNGLHFDVPISIVPAGTGNDFIKNIQIGKSLNQQFETALEGKIQSVDVGKCNDRLFLNGVGIGFDGQIVEDMVSKRVPLLTGHAAYYYHVLRILGGYRERPFSYSLDGHRHEKELILLTVGNGTTFGGGFKLMPNAKIDDGLLDVCEIGKISGIKRFLNIHKLSNGTHGTLKEVNLYQSQEIMVEENPLLFAHIDGERMGQPPYHIQILPNKIKLRVSP